MLNKKYPLFQASPRDIADKSLFLIKPTSVRSSEKILAWTEKRLDLHNNLNERYTSIEMTFFKTEFPTCTSIPNKIVSTYL